MKMMAENPVPGHPEPSPTTGRTNRPNPSHAYNIQEDRNTTMHNQGSIIPTAAAQPSPPIVGEGQGWGQ